MFIPTERSILRIHCQQYLYLWEKNPTRELAINMLVDWASLLRFNDKSKQTVALQNLILQHKDKILQMIGELSFSFSKWENKVRTAREEPDEFDCLSQYDQANLANWAFVQIGGKDMNIQERGDKFVSENIDVFITLADEVEQTLKLSDPQDEALKKTLTPHKIIFGYVSALLTSDGNDLQSMTQGKRDV